MLAFLILANLAAAFAPVLVAEVEEPPPSRGDERTELWNCSFCGEWYVRGYEDVAPIAFSVNKASLPREGDDLF